MTIILTRPPDRRTIKVCRRRRVAAEPRASSVCKGRGGEGRGGAGWGGGEGRGGEGWEGRGGGGEGANKVLQPAQSVKSQSKYDNYIECTNNKATVNGCDRILKADAIFFHKTFPRNVEVNLRKMLNSIISP